MTKGGDTIFTRNNAQLIEQQAVRNPMVDGQYFTNMTELLWSDGTITFGCLKCGEQTESRPQLSIHVGKAHNPKPAKTIKFKAVTIFPIPFVGSKTVRVVSGNKEAMYLHTSGGV